MITTVRKHVNSSRQQRILLGHLGSNGDCLYATVVARQIKHDYENCHLTWAIGSRYRAILDRNPHIDAIWDVPLPSHADMLTVWERFEREAITMKEHGEFDEIFFTQIVPRNIHMYDGMIRSSTFRGYPRPITVPITPILRLSPKEVENVHRFAEVHRLPTYPFVILFETSPNSRQSFLNHEVALNIAETMVSQHQHVCVILSSNNPVNSINPRIIDGSVLSLRENAELTKYCTLLIGCSSGITWIATSDWAKRLPMIQLLDANALWFASVCYDHEYWGLPTDHIIEISHRTSGSLCECVETILAKGWIQARQQFHERITMNFRAYRHFQYQLYQDRRYKNMLRLFFLTSRCYGFRFNFLLWSVSPFLPLQLKNWFKKLAPKRNNC